MSISNENSSITVSSREELAATIPSLLGFTPTQSVVTILLDEHRVVVTMRVDLPASFSALSAQVLPVAQRLAADSAVLAVYAPETRLETLRRSAPEVLTELVKGGLEVRDILLIDGDQFWSLTSDQEPLAISKATTPLEAERVASGLPAIAKSREDIASRFTPRPDLSPSDAMFAKATVDLNVSGADKAEMVWDALAGLAGIAGSNIDDDVLRALLILGVNDGQIRDFVLCAVACTETQTQSLVDAVVTTALRAPEEHRAQVAGTAATLLAMCGESSVPVSCLLPLATGTNLALIVTQALETAIPPVELREVMRKAMPSIAQSLTETR